MLPSLERRNLWSEPEISLQKSKPKKVLRNELLDYGKNFLFSKPTRWWIFPEIWLRQLNLWVNGCRGRITRLRRSVYLNQRGLISRDLLLKFLLHVWVGNSTLLLYNWSLIVCVWFLQTKGLFMEKGLSDRNYRRYSIFMYLCCNSTTTLSADHC